MAINKNALSDQWSLQESQITYGLHGFGEKVLQRNASVVFRYLGLHHNKKNISVVHLKLMSGRSTASSTIFSQLFSVPARCHNPSLSDLQETRKIWFLPRMWLQCLAIRTFRTFG